MPLLGRPAKFDRAALRGPRVFLQASNHISRFHEGRHIMPETEINVQISAALCEQVYRRAEDDQEIHDDDMPEPWNVGEFDTSNSRGSLLAGGFRYEAGFFDNDNTGFVGRASRGERKAVCRFSRQRPLGRHGRSCLSLSLWRSRRRRDTARTGRPARLGKQPRHDFRNVRSIATRRRFEAASVCKGACRDVGDRRHRSISRWRS